MEVEQSWELIIESGPMGGGRYQPPEEPVQFETPESITELRELIAAKDAVEAEILSIVEELEADGGPGVSGSLVDDEGFPRADIDIPAVRLARNRLACLQNDHKSMMKTIEEGLHTVHKKAKSGSDVGVDPNIAAAIEAVESLSPFARVDEVADNGPAAAAGIRVGDRIVAIGSVDASNNDGLKGVAVLVQSSVGSPLRVVVERGGSGARFVVKFTPQEWEGRGLLGCKIVPV